MLREEVEENHDGGGYWCECHAWNDVADPSTNSVPRSATSSRTVIHVACMYRHGLSFLCFMTYFFLLSLTIVSEVLRCIQSDVTKLN